MCNRRFGSVNVRKNFHADALALFPQRQGLPYRFVLIVNSAGLNGLTDERLLVGCQFYLHAGMLLLLLQA